MPTHKPNSSRHREEELGEPAGAQAGQPGAGGGAGSGGAQAPPSERGSAWMAHAETGPASPARAQPPLWADGQFHLLEMQAPGVVNNGQQAGAAPLAPQLPSSAILKARALLLFTLAAPEAALAARPPGRLAVRVVRAWRRRGALVLTSMLTHVGVSSPVPRSRRSAGRARWSGQR